MKMLAMQALVLCVVLGASLAKGLGVTKDCQDGACLASRLADLDYQEKWQAIIDSLNSGWGKHVLAEEDYDRHSMTDGIYNISDGNHGNQFNFQEYRIHNMGEQELIIFGVALSRDKGVYEDDYEMIYVTDFSQNMVIIEDITFYSYTGEGKIFYKPSEGHFYNVGNMTVSGNGYIAYNTSGTFRYVHDDIVDTKTNGGLSITAVNAEFRGEVDGDKAMMQGIEVFTTEDLPISHDSSKMDITTTVTTLDVQSEFPVPGKDGTESFHATGRTESEGYEVTLTFEETGYLWDSIDGQSFPKGLKLVPKLRVPRAVLKL